MSKVLFVAAALAALKLLPSVALSTAVVAGAALVSFASPANATTYVFDGDFSGTIVDLDITVSGSDITGLSGTVSGYGSVSTYTDPVQLGVPAISARGYIRAQESSPCKIRRALAVQT